MSTDEATDEGEKIEADPAEVLDPADYNQNQRLKEIHTARKEVREALKEVTHGKAPPSEHKRTRRELAATVAFYGHELLPLMDEAGWSHEFEGESPIESVRGFVRRMGRYPEADWEKPPQEVSMAVFDRLNQFTREIGLGADFDSESDEWEV